jgi:putative DNA-invertase from lambdoid prophage Rac
MKRAALYLRVSTDEQTVENQRPELVRLASTRGLEVVKTYEENASAAKVRPAFDRMMQDAHGGRFDVLIIWAIDRFGRSMLANLQAVLALDARNVMILSARESWLELQGPARQLLIGVFSWVAEQERNRLSERTIAGMARAREQGKQIGRPKVRVDFAHADLVIAELHKKLDRMPTQGEVAKRLGVSRASYCRALERERAERRAGVSKGGAKK